MSQIVKYQKKISGPLLDRIDIHLEVPRVNYDKLSEGKSGESSIEILKRVVSARSIQKERFSGNHTLCNSEMSLKEIKKYCQLDTQSTQLLLSASKQLSLSARGFHRILKLSRTIADLEKSKDISTSHIAEALQYRPKSRITI